MISFFLSVLIMIKQLLNEKHGMWLSESHKQVGPGCLVCCLQLPTWWSNLPEHQWELDFRVVELLGALPFAQLCWDGGSLNDLDAWKPHPMTRRHFSVHLFNGTIESGISVFLVHVVIASSTLIPQPNSIVLNLGRIFLKNLQSQIKTNYLLWGDGNWNLKYNWS